MRSISILFMSLFVTLVTYFVSTSSHDSLFRHVASSKVSEELLREEIVDRMFRVPEFKKIAELCDEMGIKNAYLFGGTASAYAHYVYWDVEREIGIGNYQADRFDYDYTNIFRSNQDLDIVIDAEPEKAELLERKLEELFPFFQGDKSAWEVRLLREDRGAKERILGNPDFIHQNTDSHSTGLIEITKNDKIPIRDFREWEKVDNHFFKDVFERKLHYYRNRSKHITTKRYMNGFNPEILSAIRYLTKAFQYELDVSDEELRQVKQVIDEFNPSDVDIPYIKTWIEKNGKKLIQNAVNIEYAWNKLEELGLRKKLIEIKGDTNEKWSLSWWMNKEPLRGKALGTTGKTARELGLDIVAHETDTFQAFESITKSHTGMPNVLISRKDVVGEAAAFGEGFYTKIGRIGARDTGITIRFKVNPMAREGIDFVVKTDYIIFLNKNALTVIPESMHIPPVEYFRKIAAGKLIFDHSDRAVQENVRRRVLNRTGLLSKDQIGEIRTIIHEMLDSELFNETLLKEWINLPVSGNDSNLINYILKHRDDKYIIREVLSYAHHFDIDRLKDYAKDPAKIHEISKHVLSNPVAANYPELYDAIFRHIVGGNAPGFFVEALGHNHNWKYHKYLETLIAKRADVSGILNKVLIDPDFPQFEYYVKKIVDQGEISSGLIRALRKLSDQDEAIEMIDNMMTSNPKGLFGEVFSAYIFDPDMPAFPKWIHNFMEQDVGSLYLADVILDSRYENMAKEIFERTAPRHRELYTKIMNNLEAYRKVLPNISEHIDEAITAPNIDPESALYGLRSIKDDLSDEAYEQYVKHLLKDNRRISSIRKLVEYIQTDPFLKNKELILYYFAINNPKVSSNWIFDAIDFSNPTVVRSIMNSGMDLQLLTYYVFPRIDNIEPYVQELLAKKSAVHDRQLVATLSMTGNLKKGYQNEVIQSIPMERSQKYLMEILKRGQADWEITRYPWNNLPEEDLIEILFSITKRGNLEDKFLQEFIRLTKLELSQVLLDMTGARRITPQAIKKHLKVHTPGCFGFIQKFFGVRR